MILQFVDIEHLVIDISLTSIHELCELADGDCMPTPTLIPP